MKKFKILAFATLLLTGYGATAQAALVDLIFTPASCVPGNCWTQDNNPGNLSTSDIETLVGTTSTLTSLYKQNVGDGFDTGTFATSYETFFDNTPGDPSNAVIQLLAGQTPITCEECYLLVKDGSQAPSLYVFAISGVGMINKITMLNFWPGNGSISHVEIMGAPGVSEIPVPAAVWLFGTALIGFAGMARRRKV
jgi:hypothetical protein